MPTFLQPVEIPEHCFLYEVLYWVAFQRLPVAYYDFRGKEIREIREDESDEHVDKLDGCISEEEAKRANLPPDPSLVALLQDRSTSTPDFYDDLLKRFDPTEEQKAQILEERAQAEQLQRELEVWEPLYERAVEYPKSRVFVALRAGQLPATGRLLSDRELEDPQDVLRTAIPSSFWSLSGIDFESSTAKSGSVYYCHICCPTADMLALFPHEGVGTSNVKRIGDDLYVVDELVQRQRAAQGQRGRPSYPWEPFYVEVAAIERGELPTKKEAAIQHFQDWFQAQRGIRPSRAVIGEKLMPYYERFIRRGGQKSR